MEYRLFYVEAKCGLCAGIGYWQWFWPQETDNICPWCFGEGTLRVWTNERPC